MDKRKHKRSRRFLSALMVLAMLVSLMPAGAYAQDGATEPIQVAWESSKSKTATNLDANHESEVTLSLPAADYEKSIDVVFVIDDTHAGSGIFAESAKGLVDSLAAQDNLDIKLGIVTFDAVARDWLEVTSGEQYSGLESLEDDNTVTAIKNAIGTELSSSGEGKEQKLGGSNTEWAVDMATEMLNNGTGSEKYMVMFSDMYGYVYRGDLTVDGTTYQNVPLSKRLANYTLGQLCISDPMYDTWNEVYEGQKSDRADLDSFFRYKNDGPSAWNNYWTNYVGLDQAPDVDTAFEASLSAPQYEEGKEGLVPYRYFTPFEKSLCKTYDHLMTALDSDINIAIVNNDFDPGSVKVQKLKNEMLDAAEAKNVLVIQEATGNGEQFSSEQMTKVFNTLKNELIQVVDQGSYVIDEIGSDSYQMGGKTYTYDFKFVNDIDKLTLTVGGQELTAEAIERSGATAAWKFGDSAKADQFELYYYEDGAIYEGHDHDGKECLVWKINVPIMKDTPVQLTYSVKLTDPQTDAGTYGQYDANGSHAYSGLFTNNSATLYPVDSLGNANYAPEEFQKPTVSYTVGSVIIEPADITIYTGGDGYKSVVDGVGSEIGDPEQGLPTPGYLITLPEEIDDEYFDGKDEASDLSNRVQFVYDGNGDGEYKDTGADRVWKLEMYSQGEDATSQTSDEVARYVYRMDADELSKEPVRLQFTQGDQFMTSDEFEISVAELYQEFNMTIYPGELDRGNIKAQILDTEGNVAETLGVEVGDATLTIRGTTENEVINAVGTETSDVTKNDHHITAVASDADTSYVINESNVSVAPDQVSLLSDELVTTEPLQEYIVENDIADSTANYQYRYLDLVDTTNGNAWVTADKLVDIYWKLPDGASADDEFQIVHFQGLDREYDDVDTKLDQNEPVVYSENNGLLSIEKIDGVDYLKFSTRTFSPFVLVWDEASNDNPGGPVIPSDPDDPDPDTPDLNTDDHYSYIVGYPEDYRTGEATDDESLWPVKPQGNITRAEVATIFYRLLTNDARDENWTTSNSFTDVSADSWYNTPVSTLSAMGLIEGYEDGSFRPDNPITRAEFAAIAGRFFTDNDAIYEPGTFSDIEGAEWFADAVQAAKDHDIIGGYPDGSFKPNNPITRAEACSIVNRTTKRVPDADHLLALDEMRNWPDNADTSAWYYADMQEATNGHYYDYVLDENDEIVREEWTSERAPIDWEQVEEELEASH